jgi:hypothetical protein
MVNAKMIALSLGGKRAGCAWMACCPAHHDRQPSLSIGDAQDGNVLVHCHAGCEQARVIAALKERGLWDVTLSKQRQLALPRKRTEPSSRRHLAVNDSGAPHAGGGLSCSAGSFSPGVKFTPLSPRPEAPVWRRLAEHGRAGDARC